MKNTLRSSGTARERAVEALSSYVESFWIRGSPILRAIEAIEEKGKVSIVDATELATTRKCMLDNNEALKELEAIGWPCRLVELPGLYRDACKQLVDAQSELANVRKCMLDTEKELLLADAHIGALRKMIEEYLGR